MSTQSSLEAFRKANITEDERKVVLDIIAHPGAIILDIVERTRIEKGTVTARITGLREKGMVFYVGKERRGKRTYSKCVAETTPSSWRKRRLEYEKERDLKDIKNFGKKLKRRMMPNELEVFRSFWKRIKSSEYEC